MSTNDSTSGVTLDQAQAALRERERHLEVVIDSSPALVSYIDAELRYRLVNRQYEQWFGLRREQIVGRTMEEVLGPAALQVLRPYIARALQGETVHFERQAPYRSGGTRWIEAQYVPDKGDGGSVRGFFVFVLDVTERRFAEQRLRESEQRFRTLADTAPAMLWVTDTSGACTFLSRGWLEFTGQIEAEALGTGWLAAVHPEDRERAGALFEVANAARREFAFDYRLRDAKGDYRWALDAGRPRFGAKGEFEGFIGSVIDIHERKHAEQVLQEADRRKDEFLATLAHELRNPLAPIGNAVRLMRMKGSADPELQWAQEVVERQVGQMARLLDDLLDVNRIARGVVELQRRPVTLGSVIESALEMSRALIEQSRHRLEVVLPADPVPLDADPVRLAQVFANLLNNAAKYTPAEGRIEVRAVAEGPAVTVSVSDTGIGIEPEVLPKIFGMFAQAESARARSRGGLGVGLALVKALVGLHGGSVEALSGGSGRGSTFRVRLPLASRPVTAAEPSPLQAAIRSVRGRRILIADDLPDSVDSLGRLLREVGYEVATARDGAEAVAVAASFQPDIALLDLGMPRLNGYDACAEIRRMGRPVKLIALSGWGQAEDRRRTQAAGFDLHLVKPVDPARLMDTVAAMSRD